MKMGDKIGNSSLLLQGEKELLLGHRMPCIQHTAHNYIPCLNSLTLKSDGDVSPLKYLTILGHCYYLLWSDFNDRTTRHSWKIKCRGAQCHVMSCGSVINLYIIPFWTLYVHIRDTVNNLYGKPSQVSDQAIYTKNYFSIALCTCGHISYNN